MASIYLGHSGQPLDSALAKEPMVIEWSLVGSAADATLRQGGPERESLKHQYGVIRMLPFIRCGVGSAGVTGQNNSSRSVAKRGRARPIVLLLNPKPPILPRLHTLSSENVR